MVPSLDKETEYPELSFAASPSISLPNWLQVLLAYWYTLTCPEFEPLPSLLTAPMATIVPSLDKEADHPELSFAASPSISPPN